MTMDHFTKPFQHLVGRGLRHVSIIRFEVFATVGMKVSIFWEYGLHKYVKATIKTVTVVI